MQCFLNNFGSTGRTGIGLEFDKLSFLPDLKIASTFTIFDFSGSKTVENVNFINLVNKGESSDFITFTILILMLSNPGAVNPTGR